VEQTALTTAAFLDQTSKFSSEALSAACRKLGRAGGPFPPSAGDLYTACVEAQRAVDWQKQGAQKLDLSKYRLPSPVKRGYTAEQLADWNLIINGRGSYTLRTDADGKTLTIPRGYPGAGNPAAYGYLTPAEAEYSRNEKQQSKPRNHFGEAAE
jgi:hypothetical protein